MEQKCSACKQTIVNQPGSVRFKCPKCMKEEIVRCGHCRKIVAKYTCPGCGFQGPN